MERNTILKYALMHAVGAIGYVALVSAFISNAEKILNSVQGYLGGMMFLLLFVTSAAIMGMLVFLRPLMWYLDGQKKEGVMLAVYTVGFLATMMMVVFVAIFFVSQYAY